MRVLKWLPAAVEDLIAIVDFISDDNINAAQQLKDEIEAKAEKLVAHP
ncbi:MAG: type II toxin-antitoxin system RelE/ParE family toxin [Pseudorhizobium sp.]